MQVADLISSLLPPIVSVARLIWPRFAIPCFIPTNVARGLVFKLLKDVYYIPSLLKLLNICIMVCGFPSHLTGFGGSYSVS